MRNNGFWDDYADAMAQTAEGNRQIALAIVAGLRNLTRRAGQWLHEGVQGLGQNGAHPSI